MSFGATDQPLWNKLPVLKKLCLSVTLVGISSALAAETGVPPAPEVFFAYGRIYDEACANGFGLASSEIASARLNPAWAAEIKERLPEFQRVWRQEGLPFVEELPEILSQSFCAKRVHGEPLCLSSHAFHGHSAYSQRHALFEKLHGRSPDEHALRIFHSRFS